MFKDILDLFRSPLGLVAALGLVATPAGRDMARKAAKVIVRTTVEATETIKEIYQEVKDEENDTTASNGGRSPARISSKSKAEG